MISSGSARAEPDEAMMTEHNPYSGQAVKSSAVTAVVKPYPTHLKCHLGSENYVFLPLAIL